MIAQRNKSNSLIERVKRVVTRKINLLLFYVFQIVKVKENYIIFESEGDLSDNAYALYDYMHEKKIDRNYMVIWLVDNPSNYVNREKLRFVQKYANNPNFLRAYYLAVAKYYLYDHCNVYSDLKKRKEQQIIFLNHGCGYKAAKAVDRIEKKTLPDEVYVTGMTFANSIADWCGVGVERIRNIGFPRLDYFFQDNEQDNCMFREQYELTKYNKIFLMMLTYRQCDNKNLSENHITNETGMPLFSSQEDIERLNEVLKENNEIIILKIHHLQSDLNVFRNYYSNIIILKDYDISKMGVQLYQIIPLSDALITDFSSITYDYLLLNKPMIHILSDLEEYKSNRGFYNGFNIEQTLAGYHVYTMEQLFAALNDVRNNVDRYRVERISLRDDCHRHIDGNASKRILEHLNIR